VSWKIRVDRRVKKDLKTVPKPVIQRIRLKMESIAENPVQCEHFALKGDKLKGFFRLRVGNWRVFYTLDNDNQEITIWSVIHRKDAYKK